MNDSRNSNLGDWFRSLIQSLKGIKEGFNSTTGTYGGGGIDEVNSQLGDIKTSTSSIKTNTDTIKSDISTVKSNTTTTKNDIASIKTDVHAILELLQEQYNS